MGCCFDLFIFFLSTILIIVQYYDHSTAAQPQFARIIHNCSGDNYPPNSTYQANLNLLLSSLSSSSITIFNYGYGQTIQPTVGQGLNTVYGAFQCRGDIKAQACQDCVTGAVQEITKSNRCPNSKQAIIWYDEFCSVRYSNESFFSIVQERPSFPFLNDNNATDPKKFNELLDNLMDNLITKVVTHDGSSDNKLFATGETTNPKIYGLVQCTYDLSSNSCNTCLRGSITEMKRCCVGRQGVRVVTPSCYIRYEIYPFYESADSTPSSPSPLIPPRNRTTTNRKGNKSSKLVAIIVVPSLVTMISTIIIIWYFCLRRRMATKKIIEDVQEVQSAESLKFNLSTIIAATNNFSDANMLGRGGFGSVYKGTLSDGQEVAVKRLSESSGQGEEEFKNEVVLLVKLQHINLVRLLGFCLDGEEKLLIYEFMPHGSLDQLIFDPVKRTYLGWEKRYKIIGGIARGLLYLHEDSRLRIIHRDLKASNVLLGDDMIPKISDFGMARIFMLNQTQASTNRICGTYGYMAPEYAMHGQFSVKSDVFSFGVLVLEILIGKRSNSFHGSEGAHNLLSYAWRHWREGTTSELLDPTLKEHYSRIELMRCIHIGLLCVQEDTDHRPTMTWIVHNLNNHSTALPSPSSPSAFFVRNIHSGESQNYTVNEASITELYPR